MKHTANELFTFIRRSPSAFHAVATVKEALTEAGYRELSAGEHIRPGEGYFVTESLSSILAFRAPKRAPESYLVAAAHTDSPAFLIKEEPECGAAGLYTQIRVEKYGGMICSSWLDRPLSAAGRAVVATEGGAKTRLVDLDRDLFLIPSVAIHMNRSVNENASYNPAVDLQPISGSLAAKGGLRALLAEACGCTDEELLSDELFLYVREEGRVWGVKNEFLSSPRLDDLQCAFALLQGFLAAEAREETCPVLALFDSEEVGSATRQGAASPFLASTLARIHEDLGGDRATLSAALASSMMVSADNAHAHHPNHPELSDPVHRPAMNGGIVIKHNASRKYATDALSDAIFRRICQRADVPFQHFSNRPDLPGGSTLGSIAGTKIPLLTVDIGLPQLSMHSAYETAGVLDTDYLIRAMSVFFSCRLKAPQDGEFSLIFE